MELRWMKNNPDRKESASAAKMVQHVEESEGSLVWLKAKCKSK